MIASIRTLWGWLRGDCIECEHSHYDPRHHAYMQSCPRVPSCNCYEYVSLFSVFFVTGLQEFRRRHVMRMRLEQRELEELRKKREQRAR
jgi:hypothetical protein